MSYHRDVMRRYELLKMAAFCCTDGLRNLYLFFSFHLYDQNNLGKVEGSQRRTHIDSLQFYFVVNAIACEQAFPARNEGLQQSWG